MLAQVVVQLNFPVDTIVLCFHSHYTSPDSLLLTYSDIITFSLINWSMYHPGIDVTGYWNELVLGGGLGEVWDVKGLVCSIGLC